MTEKSIRERVLDVVGATLGKETVSSADTLQSLGADSLDAVELVIALEMEFDTDLRALEDDMSNTSTVDHIIALVEKHHA